MRDYEQDPFGGLGDFDIADGWQSIKVMQDALAMGAVQMWWINWLLGEVVA